MGVGGGCEVEAGFVVRRIFGRFLGSDLQVLLVRILRLSRMFVRHFVVLC